MDIQQINFYKDTILIYAEGLEFECPRIGGVEGVYITVWNVSLIFESGIMVIFSKKNTIVRKGDKEYVRERGISTIEGLTKWIKEVITNV